MAIVLKKISKLPFAPVVAGLFALVAAALVMATPIWLLEDVVTRVGLDSVIAAAAPPLGMKAHALLGIAAAFGTGAALWVLLLPVARMLDRKKPKMARTAASTVPSQNEDVNVGLSDEPVLRGRRRPILAEQELGAPFMSDEALSDAPIYPPVATEPTASPEELVLDDVFADLKPADGQDADAVMPAPEPEPQPEPVQQLVPQVTVSFETDKPKKAYALPVPPPSEYESQESISDLVLRLEQGLNQRAATIEATQAAAEAAMAADALHQAEAALPQSRPGAAAEPAPQQPEVRDVDSALRQALNTLERLAVGAR